MISSLQEAKQQETSMPCFEGTKHSAVGHFSAFIPDSTCQQPFLVCLRFVSCARTNLGSWSVHTWEAHVTAMMWRQRSRMVREKSRRVQREFWLFGGPAADHGKGGCRLAFSSLLCPSLQLLCSKVWSHCVSGLCNSISSVPGEKALSCTNTASWACTGSPYEQDWQTQVQRSE